jgi:hypothetical protein
VGGHHKLREAKVAIHFVHSTHSVYRFFVVCDGLQRESQAAETLYRDAPGRPALPSVGAMGPSASGVQRPRRSNAWARTSSPGVALEVVEQDELHSLSMRRLRLAAPTGRRFVSVARPSAVPLHYPGGNTFRVVDWEEAVATIAPATAT